MNVGPKLMVFKLKELVYTGIFVVLAIILILLLVNIFLGSSQNEEPKNSTYESSIDV